MRQGAVAVYLDAWHRDLPEFLQLIASIRVGESMLGRVIDPLGEPLDGKGLIGGELYNSEIS